MFCNYNGTTTVCSARYSDSGGWFADLGDGMSDVLALVHTREYHERCTSWADPAGRGSAPYCADPLNQLRTPGLTFPYRLATAFTGGTAVHAFCVPYTWGLWRGRTYMALGTSTTFPIPKKSPQGQGEACYYGHPPRPAPPDAAKLQELPSAAQARTVIPPAAQPVAAETKDDSAAPSGSLRITSNPQSAGVYVDDAFVGNCPAVLHLTPGKHILRFTLVGYKEKTMEITVLPSSESNVVANLDKS